MSDILGMTVKGDVYSTTLLSQMEINERRISIWYIMFYFPLDI